MQKKPKYKLCRRLGGIYEKCQSQKYALSEAKKRKTLAKRRVLSDYGRQLIEKQKVRFAYGLTEKQFKKYVHTAMKAQDTVSALHKTLEMRLDNIVYKLGFAPTRRAARQLVSHGHITVNGRKIKIPSYLAKVGDKIEVREGSKNRPYFQTLVEKLKSFKTEKWLNLDSAKLSAEVLSEPVFDPNESMFDYVSVFEFYTR